MSKKEKLYFRIVPLLLAAFFVIVLSSIVLNSYGVTTRAAWLPLLIPELVGILGYTVIILLIWKFIIKRLLSKKPNIKVERRAVIIFFAILIILQILFALQISMPWSTQCVYDRCIWDFNIIASGARDAVNGGLSQTVIDYLHVCSNNIFFFNMIKGLFQAAAFFGINNLAVVGVGVNILFINVSLLLMYLTARKLFGVKKALFALAVAAFILPLTLFYVPIFYTDTMSLPFAIAIIYLYLKLREAKPTGKFVGLLVALAFVTFVGMMIKMSVLIALIAVAIDAIIRLKKDEWKRLLLSFAVIIVVITPLFMAHNALANKYIHSRANPETVSLPLTHYIMLGMDYGASGSFSVVSRDVTLSAKSQEEAVRLNLDAMKYLLDRNGFFKSVHLLYKKANIDWYSGGDYESRYRLKNSNINTEEYKPSALQKAIGFSDVYPFTILNFMSAMQILLLAALAIGSWLAWRSRKPDNLAVLRLTIFGLVLFLLIWEANPRYTFNFLPITILLATPVLYDIAPRVIEKIRSGYLAARRKLLKY